MLFISLSNLYADSEIKFYHTIAHIGGGVNYSTGRPFEYSASLGNFYIEHRKTHLGLEYELLRISIFYNENISDNNHNVSFFNPTLYWNILQKGKNILGPFVSINYLTLNNPLEIEYEEKKFIYDDYIMNSGIKILWQPVWDIGFLPLWLIGCELGYKRKTNSSGFYFLFSLHFS